MGCNNPTSIETNENKKENNNNNNNENNFSTSNIDLMMGMKEEYPDNFPEAIKKLGNNVIYYDQHFEKRKNEIYKDAEMFKIFTKGAFILVTNKHALFLVLKEINELKTNCKFDLICPGSSCKEILDLIKNKNFLHIFKRCCIFTYNPEIYSDIPKKYPLVKGIFFDKSQVLEFLEEESNSTPILRTLNLVTLNDYENNASF